MNPTQPPSIQEPIRYPVEKSEQDHEDKLKEKAVKAPVYDTIQPYGYEDTKEYSYR